MQKKTNDTYGPNAVYRTVAEMFKGNEVMRWRVQNLIERVREYEQDCAAKKAQICPNHRPGLSGHSPAKH